MYRLYLLDVLFVLLDNDHLVSSCFAFDSFNHRLIEDYVDSVNKKIIEFMMPRLLLRQMAFFPVYISPNSLQVAKSFNAAFIEDWQRESQVIYPTLEKAS